MDKKIKELITTIKKLSACRDSIEWLSSQDNLQQAWEDCERGDWLLWLVARLNINERKLFLAKGLVVEQIIHLMNDQGSINAVHAAIDYGNGKIGKDELKIFADTAYDAADAAAAAARVADAYDAYAAACAAAAAYAAYAAAYAAANAHAANAAAYATYAAANAAYVANADDDDDLSVSGKKLFLKKAAEIIRQVFNFEEIESGF